MAMDALSRLLGSDADDAAGRTEDDASSSSPARIQRHLPRTSTSAQATGGRASETNNYQSNHQRGSQRTRREGDDQAVDSHYRSFPDETGDEETTLRRSEAARNTKYRGFNTSINDMFVDPELERVDCCALACCGVFQSDRDRYLLTGYKPPSTRKRCFMHILLPIGLFINACLCAVKIRDPVLNAVLSCGFLLLLIGYLIFQCFKGTWKRRDVRKELLWTKYQLLTTGEILHQRSEDSSLIEDHDDSEEPEYYLGQTRGDIRRAHAPCSCYVRDTPLRDDPYDDGDMEPVISICTTFFRCFTNVCCGMLCGMHCQLCGMCGMAQEARQVERIFPAVYRRIDYITMEPFTNYYSKIYEARYPPNNSQDAPNISNITWWSQLSKLSIRIIGAFCCCLGLLVFWGLLAERMGHSFGPASFSLLCGAFLQAFIFLYFVYIYSSKDLSLDALIKFFASGFFLTASFAVTFEFLIGLTIRVTMSIIMAISGIDVVEDNGYGGDSSKSSSVPGYQIWVGPTGMDSSFNASGTSGYRDYLHVYGREHPFVFTIYLFITAFFLAATIEELSKYFGYRMVDHPDFLSRRQLEAAAECFDPTEDGEEVGQRHHLHDYSRRQVTLESKGSMITVAMVTVSLGFACCENLIYIFIYTEPSLGLQLLVLFARSIFPVHQIAAAMQSLRVCERDLERNKGISLGRIITPSVIFHGGYDFCLMWIQFMATKDGQYVDANDDALESKDKSTIWSVVIALVFVIGGTRYFFRQSKGQKERLQSLDQDAVHHNSTLV